ncbi:MAG: accessory Sec system translocase SecA2, partial [Gemmatimonadetes bacterium]|nr:accessory Sec system translocase SecA2 [Gemmatimonadota bacterium]
MPNFHHLLERLRGSTIERDLCDFESVLTRIDSHAQEIIDASDEDLQNRAATLRLRAQEPGADLDDVLVPWFVLVREVAGRMLHMRPFDVQMLASICLYHGKIAEMQTGEGKTLAAVAPASLRALVGRGVHVLTFNDYLAKRDAEWMGPVYRFLGLRVGIIQAGMDLTMRRAAYACDITYATAKEAGFDYLRDQMVLDMADRVHRGTHCALVDEADSILIDEARVPLVVAGAVEATGDDAERMADLVRSLTAGDDFDTDEYARNVHLTDAGLLRVETALACGSLHDAENLHHLTQVNLALHARVLLAANVDYIVRQGRVEIIDEFTGRVVDDRHWPDGLQSAIEAKERVQRRDDGVILGSITLQHFLEQYEVICGMTATACPAAEELAEMYQLGVVVIPPNRCCRREDEADILFTHRAAKHAALVRQIQVWHHQGRPVLVGTASVAESEELGQLLREADVTCQILNARNDETEAHIIADAGALGAVTISTNMAGRG